MEAVAAALGAGSALFLGSIGLFVLLIYILGQATSGLWEWLEQLIEEEKGKSRNKP